MTKFREERAYRTATADSTTQLGLLIEVYDAIASDLRSAELASLQNDIAARCGHCNHAFALLGHIESWVDLLDEPTLATSLKSFYAMLRTRMLQLQQRNNEQGFKQLAELVTETRAVWQRKQQMLYEALAQNHTKASYPQPPCGTLSPLLNRSSWSA